MKHNLKYITYLIFSLMICFNRQITAQILYRKSPASAEEIKQARAALEADMNSLKKHRAFIFTMDITNPQVVLQYRAWMKKYPENVNIPLSAGTVYYNAEMPQGREFLEKAAAMQPNNAKIWAMLSGDAVRRGEKKSAIAYLQKASLADTLNADYASSYLMSLEDSDLDYKTKVFDFVKRFPTSVRGAQVLYWFAEQTTNITEKINYFEELRKAYPPQKYQWSSDGMIGLADAYLQTDPQKALTLINQMDDGKDWQMRKQVAKLLIQANLLEQSQNYKGALAKLDLILLPKFNYIKEYLALRKASLLVKTGNIKTAYDSLALKFSTLPSDGLYTTLELYGKKLEKNNEQITTDIQTLRNNTAVTAYPFNLGLYTSKGKLSLESLKGKVVLLTFWFPACGPCRAEFPHFQAVIDKFKGKDVVYIGINVHPEQDPYVIPMLKNTKYSFTPLRGTPEFALKNYGVDSEPENFLIDKKGKIIFKNFTIDESNHRTLELMISSLL